MNYIFITLLLVSFFCAIINGKMDEMVTAMMIASKKSVELALAMVGVMGFWLGIVNIAKKSGLMDIFAKLIKKPLLGLMPDLKDNSSALSNVALNISANALGVANAATPFGIKAMEDMNSSNENKKTATNSMCMFLAMNTAGFQLVPAMVLAVLIANGMDNPSQIILPTLIVTSIAFISAIFFAKILERYFK